ncbi:DNA-3-methyladenine glycosylase 2 [Phytohabitans flavus]|uniref:AraC family transcriptional regulator n=1 Tax=Phytohabitans flavus TaxID=1076124 RepID=A0A6F8XXS4_9ACTN|nr:AlkA N-terminal domain-containing protein [Phytohabitans flavus]BCB78654.1 AraC family transcriptional regulator [Phytohabitans flavus]
MTTYSAVVTTGIYCRPGCGARPRAENVRTFELAAAAEAAGFRACLRCRPYRIAGELPWDAPELVCRAVQLIIGGALDEGTEADLGRRLGMSSRHLRRLFHEHLGVTPDQFARSRRAHFARRMLDDTDLTVADVAFASGFGSLRQFNRTMREVFRATPQALRERRRRADRLTADGGLGLRLPVEPPYDWDATLAFLAGGAIPGVEAVDGGTYRRTITLDGGPGLLEIWRGGHDHLLLRAHLPYWEGLIHVVERVRRMLGLDVDFAATGHLAGDPIVGPLLKERPGLRVPGAWGPFEAGVAAIARQHHDTAGARELLGRLARDHGPVVPGLDGGLDRVFPAAEVVASAAGVPDPVRRFAAAVGAGEIRLDGTDDLAGLVASLTAIPGIGDAAAHHLAMRLGERDAFPAGDPALVAALGPDAVAVAQAWRPWRALAATHLLADELPRPL